MATLKYQLPVHSPVTLAAIGHAALSSLQGTDQHPDLEALLRRSYRADSVTLCSSGTDALTRAIRGADVAHRNLAVVGLPAYSCYDLATAAVGAGAEIMLYDLDPATLGPDLDSVRRIVAAGVRTIVVAPLYGMPVEWDALESLARSAGVTLIEDAAQGHSATYHGRALGTLADFSVLSFGRGKGWTAGRGGALLQRGDARIEFGSTTPAASNWSVLAACVAQWLFGRPWSYGIPASIPRFALGETIYREPSPPCAMTRAGAALARLTFDDAVRAAAARTTSAHFFDAALPSNDQLRMVRPISGASPGYLRYPVRVRGGIAGLGAARDGRRLGIMSGYPTTLAQLAAVRARLSGPANLCPGATELARDLVTLPTHSLVTLRDAHRIVALFAARFPAAVSAAPVTAAGRHGVTTTSDRSVHVVPS